MVRSLNPESETEERYYSKGTGWLAPLHIYLLKARPFVAMGDVGFDNGPGNGSLFQESAEE